MKYLLDTNICIYLLNNKYEKIINRIETEGFDNLALSVITIAELEFGVSKSKHQDKNKIALMEFLLPFNILDFNQNDAFEYGKIRTFLQKKGLLIGNMDMLIASQVIANDLILVTNNIREFERIPEIKLENWV